MGGILSYMHTSGMLSIVGERESAHAKLEACTALWYGQCGMDSVGYIYIYIYREREREREREKIACSHH